MGPESIMLSVEESDGEGTYSFVCPVCASDVQKQADRKIVALLVSAGVCMAGRAEGDLYVSTDHRDQQPPLTADDLLAFHQLLQDDAYLEKFLSQG